MTPEADRRFMRMALGLGRRGQGRTWPNPPVGCVITREGRVVGRGWTADGGRPHAEVRALQMAGEAARGATAYVTLEPCAHHGQTPPCAEALAEAGVARVVVGASDPDSRVAGRGVAILRAAGIEVTEEVCAALAEADLAGFLSRVTRGRPHLTLKLAASFDGRIATATGESQWITGPEARRLVHMQRARSDAVMIGGGTARADDPSLTVRDLGVSRQPVRVVLSRRLDLPRPSKLFRGAAEVPVWLFHGPDAPQEAREAWREAGAELVECPVAGRQVAPEAVLAAMAERGLTRVFCEGGGSLAASLLAHDLVDELVGMTAGLALGAEGLPAIGAMGLDALSEAQRFTLAECRPIGADVLHRWNRRA